MDEAQIQNEEPIPIAHEGEDEHTHTIPTTTPRSQTQTQTQTQAQSRPQIPWQDRLTTLANLASASLGPDSKDSSTSPIIHHHLDAIESILRDPNPDPTPTPTPTPTPNDDCDCNHSPNPTPDLSIPESNSKSKSDHTNPNSKRRTSYRTKSLLGDRSASELEQPDWLIKSQLAKEREMEISLDELLGEVSFLNDQISKRREESIRIQELWEERERGFRREIAELGDEVDELREDLVEDAVELEGIQGTIHGLQNWIEGMTIMMRDERRKERKRDHHLIQVKANAKTKRGIRWGRKPEARNDYDYINQSLDQISGDDDGEIVLEGLSAWMRGWRDVEDGFQARAQGRKVKREQRRELLLKRNSTSLSDMPGPGPGPEPVTMAPVQVLG
ncbi:hypothetical protein N7456_012451 [Penicillium angulare]|uniref:Uncharacterized protein n=1 Tax=Penicillium angulare TaxID=116970 RepID=A0A9W9EVX5_9EURO|nr:hypothetical protein N7456_012451 [Penicillium angulare]